MSKKQDKRADLYGEQAKRRFVEQISFVFEEMGFPLVAGRIFAWLLVCSPPLQSAADLAAAVSASRGSISTMTRLLVRVGLVERVSVPGQRSRCYRVRPGGTVELLKVKMRLTSVLRAIADEGVAAMAGAPKAERSRVREFRDMYVFFEREMPPLVQRWQRKLHRRRQS